MSQPVPPGVAAQDAVVIREVVDPADAAVEGFGRMQVAAYFAPETLIPARFIPQLLAPDPSSTRHNFLVVAELDRRVVGGTLFHWLGDAGTSFSSFLGVDRALRRLGIARRLHERRLAVVDRAAAEDGRPAPGVFIDVVNPTRLPPAERERERTAGSDPHQRREAFAHLGFRQVDIRYEQPVGGPNGGPVTILDLLYCPRQPRESADWIPTALVAATMRAYWTPWLGEQQAQRHAQELSARARGAEFIRLVSP